ncbi:E3 ubiquitin-protein ligase bre1 [Elasticomyces elasticus]|nr:E3 ubiquitin-protein ligase bre1 [Elasticomyces elasticus]
MTAVQAPQAVALPSFDKLKMDERKRSLAVDADDLAPRAKKLLRTDENGQAMRMDAEKEKDVENYQKDAIMRQMKEYKRQKKDAEDQVTELKHKTKHHNDRLRIVDAWFAQFLDEIRTLASQAFPTPASNNPPASGDELYGSALLFENSELFSEHLHTRSDNIRSAIVDLFGRLPSASPEVESLRRQLNAMLAKEKEHAVQLREAMDEQESYNEKWMAAVERYMTAEKKLDRVKSAQVLKIERQANGGSNGEASSPTTTKKAGTPVKSEQETNGELSNGIASAETEALHREALAVAERQKAQVLEIEAENERLTNDLSAARTKLASLSDDDYADSTLCKTLKTAHEEQISRVNDLEATNITLREEAQKLQAERTTYRRIIDEESRESMNDMEQQIARAETDLARIRSVRDDIGAELEIRRKADETRRTSADQARELAEARDSKIMALESETYRLRLRLGDVSPPQIDGLDEMDAEELRTQIRTLEGQHRALCEELKSMETAYQKTSALASRKVSDTGVQEETIAQLRAEKAKAEQKYFAAMKAKDLKESELRSLRTANARSSEIVSQLKDGDTKSRELVSNLERQHAESKDLLSKLETQYRALDAKAKEAAIAVEGLKKQSETLTALVGEKDEDTLANAKAKREAEVELERCSVRLEEAKKSVEVLRKTRVAENTASGDDWRKLVICPCCNEHIRNSVLKLCGHVFCSECVQRLITNRSRKCPSCGKAFGQHDYMPIVLT